MGKRLVTAAVLIAISLAALWLWTVDNLWFAIYINLVVTLGVYEMVRNLKEFLPVPVSALLVLFARLRSPSRIFSTRRRTDCF